jgi:hypothetical protein
MGAIRAADADYSEPIGIVRFTHTSSVVEQ